jgi:hypothetical protein
MTRLRAVVGRERRIEMLPLHDADRTRHIAIANIRDAGQGNGKIEQECVAACHRQRPGRLEDSGELGVGKRDRRHGGGFRGGYSPAYAIWRP